MDRKTGWQVCLSGCGLGKPHFVSVWELHKHDVNDEHTHWGASAYTVPQTCCVGDWHNTDWLTLCGGIYTKVVPQQADSHVQTHTHTHTHEQLGLWVCVKGRPVRCWSRMASRHCSSSTSPDKDKAGGVREQQHTPWDGSPQLLICLPVPVAHSVRCTMQPVCAHCVYHYCMHADVCVHAYTLMCDYFSLIPSSVVPPECYRLCFCSLSPPGSWSEQQFYLLVLLQGRLWPVLCAAHIAGWLPFLSLFTQTKCSQETVLVEFIHVNLYSSVLLPLYTCCCRDKTY